MDVNFTHLLKVVCVSQYLLESCSQSRSRTIGSYHDRCSDSLRLIEVMQLLFKCLQSLYSVVVFWCTTDRGSRLLLCKLEIGSVAKC